MAVNTVVVRINATALINNEVVDFGGIFNPFTISTTTDTRYHINQPVTAAGGDVNLLSWTGTPSLIAVRSTVAGYLSWSNTPTDTANSSIKMVANSVVFLPSGVTTDYSATGSGRADLAVFINERAVTDLYFDALADGDVEVLVLI